MTNEQNIPGETRVVLPSQIKQLFDDISRYNDHFSPGAIAARAFGQGFSVTNEQENEEINAGLISIKHKNTLESVGLTIESVSGKNDVVLFKEGEMLGNGEIRLNIVDKKRFSGFLEALSKEQVQEQELGVNLETLVGIFCNQIRDNCDFQNMSDEVLTLLSMAGKVVTEFQRLGLENKENVERLSLYVDHINKRDLKEYLFVQKKGLFSLPGTFGPADWQIDTTLEGFADKWEDALQTLEMIKDNPNAFELYINLRSHLNNCLELAKKDLDEKKYRRDSGEKTKILKGVESRLK
jgi:hypothetical protein